MDADCGEGFSCVQYEQCSCDGSSGSADGTEPADGVGTEPNCGCSPSGEFYCELQVLPCSTASECPSGFSCEQNPETGVCNGGSSEPGGTSVEPTCEPSTGPENVCFPPYYQYGYAVDIAGEFDRAASGVPTSADGEAASGAEADDVEATGGCTVVPAAGAGSSASLLGLLALVGLAARRRTRRRAT
jgi:MYXO-CTERM domain-containing protein